MHSDANLHTVLSSEVDVYTHHLNTYLGNDHDLKGLLPIKNLFDAVEDGIILCKMVNCSAQSRIPPISPEAINLKPANTYHKIENLNLAIDSARSIGCIVVNIQPHFILEKREHIILGLVWQLIKIHLSNLITLKMHPEIIVLKREDETDDDLRRLGYEEILIRWLNWHIARNKHERRVSNLGKDLSDSFAYSNVLMRVSQNFEQKIFQERNKQQKAEYVLQIVRKQGIKTFMKSSDITSGHVRLNSILCAQIFNRMHGLTIAEKIVQVVIPQPEVETDQTREMRIFKNWINSQGINGVYVNYLMTDLRDGTILLKVIDTLRPKIVDWEKYSDKLTSRIHIIHNCNYVVELCKNTLKITVIAIGGIDIVDGNVTLTLGIVWQLCKLYWQERVGVIKDQELVDWGNSLVPQQYRIKNFKDKSIPSCNYLLHIIESIKKGTVDFDKVRYGQDQESTISRINYTIACARKLGCQIITLWEHIRQCKGKYLSIMVAELRNVSNKKQ